LKVEIPIHRKVLTIDFPETATVFTTSYPEPLKGPAEMILESLNHPVNSLPLKDKLNEAKPESVVIVVSDITRPIPYGDFLPAVLGEVVQSDISAEKIFILIATGMHRPSSQAERLHMFGVEICEKYRIIDHKAEAPVELITLSGTSYSGRPVQLNRHFMEADFRIITGLVEPHFMAGFSGGRKAVCPGLCSLDTVKNFHSYSFLDHPAARNGNLEDNPLHAEALSIARKADVGFCINLIVNNQKKIVQAVSGDPEASHEEACNLVRRHACPAKRNEADVVITSCGGYPLDATFYQCVKGMIAALPLVKQNGIILATGGCSEGIGSREYKNILFQYTDRWEKFSRDFEGRQDTLKDQWEFQMQTKVLKHIGQDNLIFATDGLGEGDLKRISVNGMHIQTERMEEELQKLVNDYAAQGKSIAVIPEGPYCTPL